MVQHVWRMGEQNCQGHGDSLESRQGSDQKSETGAIVAVVVVLFILEVVLVVVVEVVVLIAFVVEVVFRFREIVVVEVAV